MKTTSPSSPPLGQRASDLAFVCDLAQQLLNECAYDPPWCFEVLQAAGEEAMRTAARVYKHRMPALDKPPLTVWARARILRCMKKALREVNHGG